MPRLILHIGAPKTGSSALQSYLCQQPNIGGRNGPGYYAVKKDKVLTGPALSGRAKRHPLGLIASDPDIAAVFETLQKNRERWRKTMILSQEAWMQQSDLLTPDIAEDFRIEVIAWIRPQAEWFQSAWWQWFAWQGPRQTPESAWQGIKAGHDIDWARHLTDWANNPSVGSVTARLYQPQMQIVADFFNWQGLVVPRREWQGVGRGNIGVTAGHVALYKRLPFLRSPHGGTMDAMLSRFLPKTAPPPVLTHKLASEIIRTYRQANRKLTAFLPEEQRDGIRNDPRWWDPRYYAENSLK